MWCPSHLNNVYLKLQLKIKQAMTAHKEMVHKSPLELFEEKKVVRICAPMVRYSKYSKMSISNYTMVN